MPTIGIPWVYLTCIYLTMGMVMVLPRMPIVLVIIIILNLTVIAVSRTCTQRKTNLRQK